LNGRIDLTQAEAVVDLINCQSEKGLTLASRQIEGSFGKQIKDLRQKAVEILARVEAAIDFPEEESDIVPRDEAAGTIEKELIGPIEVLIEAHARKRIWVDGVKTVIVGRVNAGKSSLLNRLLEEQRAIVTPIPGTTRDVIESTITIEGLPLCLVDTAGFREARDEAERIGLHLTEKKLVEGDLLLAVIDQSRPINQDDLDIIARCRGKKSLVVINKIDLESQLTSAIEQEVFSPLPVVRISALSGQGLDALRKAIVDCALGGQIDVTTSHGAPNLRHSLALEEAVQCFRRAGRRIEEAAPMEIIAFEIKSGLDALGRIIGEATTEEVLDSIFSQFCLGK
jgi:tRNA modification GTPase